MVAGIRDVASGREPPDHATELSRKLLLGLLSAAADLNRKGVTDRVHVLAGTDSSVRIAHPRPLPRWSMWPLVAASWLRWSVGLRGLRNWPVVVTPKRRPRR